MGVHSRDTQIAVAFCTAGGICSGVKDFALVNKKLPNPLNLTVTVRWGVVTFGMRAQYRDYDTIGKGDLIQTSPQRREEYNKTKIIYTPNEMQMNTAFSKAYIIESGGSSKGLLKNRIHLDEKMLDKFVCYINQSKPTEFGLTDEDFEENGPCICKYNAVFEKCKKVLTVTANVNDATWDCLRIEFDNVIPYENDKQALTTHLFTPKRVFDSLYSPHDSGILEL